MANSEVLNQAEVQAAKGTPPRPAPPPPAARGAAPKVGQAAQPTSAQPASARPAAAQPVPSPPVAAKPVPRPAPPPPKRSAAPSSATPPAPKSAAGGGADGGAPGDTGEPSRWSSSFLQVIFSAYFVSLALHAAVLLALWLIVVPQEVKEEIFSVLVTETKAIEEEVVMEEIDQPLEINDFEKDINPTEMPVPVDTKSDSVEPPFPDVSPEPPVIAPTTNAPTGPAAEIGSITQGRSEASRSQMLAKRGGNAASDAAVAMGLEWLQSVQRSDGSWSFGDIGASSQPGDKNLGPNGATAMALMSFLGAGHTHKSDTKYKQTVERGLGFLLRSYKQTPDGFDFRGQVVANEGMYVQGLVGIALSEAYGMTKDRRLRQAAEGCLLFIMRAQDPKGGGWRYSPRQAGDTSVVGWELMALKSGYYADIPVPRNVVAGVSHFLDTVASDRGAKYGYTGPQPKPSTTAIGLLCRMYLGWKKEHPALIEGMKYVSSVGPRKNDMYYNYYATQAMIQFTNARGEMWQKWNTAMRDWLVETQKKSGPEKGSWDVADAHGSKGGRLYMTCLCVMTLEVYYRVLPLYKQEAVQDEL